MAEGQWGGRTDTPQTSSSQKKRKRSEDGDELPVKRKAHSEERITTGDLYPDIEDFITNNYVNLTNMLEVKDVIRYLIQDRVLTTTDKQRILSKETKEDKAEELIDTLSSSGKCTPKKFINILQTTNQTGLIHRLSLKNKYQELHSTDPVLPVRLQLAVVSQTSAQVQAGDKEPKDKILERILELERTLFTVEVLNDPVRYKKVRNLFKRHKAFLKKALDGSILLLLMFLRQTDVDRFYHNHYRVGEGSLSQQLSHILILEHLQDKVKGAQLIVRLQVKHEDYVRVRDRLGRGLDRTTSADNLLALPPPRIHVDHSILRALDLAMVSREHMSCSSSTDDISILKFTAREVQEAVRKAKKQQVQVKLQTMRGQLETARQDADAMRKEVARMKEEEEKVQKLLSKRKEDIQRLEEVNKTMREDIKAAREQTQATVLDSVTKETAYLRKKDEEAQRSLQKQQEEIQQLQETNKNLTATTEKLTAENTKMSNQLTEIPELREEVREWREKNETAQKVLSEQELEIQQLQETNKSMAATCTIEELIDAKHTAKGASQGQGYGREGGPSEQIDSTSGHSRLSDPEDKPKASNKATKARGSVLLVSDEYGTSKGGVSTINLNAARVLTAAGGKVYATVLEASAQDERDAERDGVRLLKPHLGADSSTKPSLEWLTVYHSVHFPHIPSDVSCIVGHVDVTSRAARKIKEERFPHAKLAMFGHVAPEETEHYKSDEKALGVGRKEASIQDDISKADVVFSVGPRIHRHYDRFLRRNHVDHHIFLPEPSKVFSEAKVVEKPERVVLSIGRVQNVEMLKGHDLVAGAIDKAAQRLENQYTLRLRVRGIDENDFEKSKRILEEKLRSGRVKPSLLPYGTQEEIRRDMDVCHLVVMPSRAEPFGLIGLEAIAAGVPVLISEQTGLAELIEELSDRLGQPTFRHCIVKMKGDTATDEDVEKWAERIEDVLKNTRSVFAEACAFREKLLASKYWEESHQTFLQACGITDIPSAQAEAEYAEADDFD